MKSTANDLRRSYDSKEITPKEFIERLFASEEADRVRRRISESNSKSKESFP